MASPSESPASPHSFGSAASQLFGVPELVSLVVKDLTQLQLVKLMTVNLVTLSKWITNDSIDPIRLALDRFASQLTKLLLHFNDDQPVPATAVYALLAPCTGLHHLALKNIALTTDFDPRSQALSYHLETLAVRRHRHYGLATEAIVSLAGNSRTSLASFTGESLGARALAALAQAAPNLKEATFGLRSGSDNELATLRQIAGQASVRRVVVRADNRWRDRRGHVWRAAKGRVADAVAQLDEASRVKVELAWDEDDDASVSDWDGSDSE